MRRLISLVSQLPQQLKNYLNQFLIVVMATVAIQLVAAPVWATGIYEIPTIAAGEKTWIIDQAEVLSRASESKISGDLEELAKTTGKEIRFVTIHRLDYGETADSLAKQLFEAWYPTAEAQANQILIVLDNVTNGTGIQTGEQVKTVLSETTAQSVAQETMMVPIRKGNYNQALLDATDRLTAVLSGRPDPGPPQVEEVVRTEGTFKKAEETNQVNATIVVVVLLIAATVIPMATYYLYVR